jgi:hypothetical protein
MGGALATYPSSPCKHAVLRQVVDGATRVRVWMARVDSIAAVPISLLREVNRQDAELADREPTPRGFCCPKVQHAVAARVDFTLVSVRPPSGFMGSSRSLADGSSYWSSTR